LYVPELAGAELRLKRRYHHLVVAHLSHAHRLAAGLHPPPSVAKPFSAVQAAWRFFSNERVVLSQLAGPLIECARVEVPVACSDWVLVAMDWSRLHFCDHDSKVGRIELAHAKDLGYDLLTALALADGDGSPIAPLCLELRAENGTHSTRAERPLNSASHLEGLEPVMAHVEGLKLGKTPVFIIDREADSVGHYRKWDAAGWWFLVRANDARYVMHAGKECLLHEVADSLKSEERFMLARSVSVQNKAMQQFVAETTVVLHRPARTHRIDTKSGRRKHKNVAGAPLALRLIVSELRDEDGHVRARWLLLTNLSASVSPDTVALWYYWRWRIESYYKLLKGAGQQIEAWQQEKPEALSRRLLVAAMSVVVVWRLARDDTPSAVQMRDVLVRLSGRQMKRGPKARPFTEPALLAGLGVLVTMLECLRHYSITDLVRLAQTVLPGLAPPGPPSSASADDG
jgi:hypothetical protein